MMLPEAMALWKIYSCGERQRHMELISGFSCRQKHGVGTKGPESYPPMVMRSIGIDVCASSYSQATQANLWGPCMRVLERAAGMLLLSLWLISGFRFYLLEFKANCGIRFSISFPRGRVLCPHNARVQRPCQLACANTLLSNDLICNKAECLCSSSWHRTPGEVTKLLYVPLALAAMVNSPAAFMQMSVNTL